MKVAVITHYYQCKNYGGCLQAYALCRALGKLGCDAQQLCYLRAADAPANDSLPRRVYRFCKKTLRSLKSLKVSKELKARDRRFSDFTGNRIPHSEAVYTADTVVSAADLYDAFITGSDQVWNPAAYCSAYGLRFVPGDKRKLSYAASIASDSLTDSQTAALADALKDYSAISVREPEAKQILSPYVDQPIEVTLDPTLLLSADEWDELSAGRMVDEPYLFCYFLGDDIHQRELAQEYAGKHGLKVVTIPYLKGYYRKSDNGFGDVTFGAASVQEFISLVKYADTVFTDSFHASVFSVIYHTPFFAFDRVINRSMGSRVRTLVQLTGEQARFCDTAERQTLSYIESVLPQNNASYEALGQAQRMSCEFLRKNLLKDDR